MVKHIFGYILAITITAWLVITAAKNGAFVNAEKLAIPPPYSFFTHGKAPERYASFGGTWRIDGEETAFPNHAYKYTCMENLQYCDAVDVSLSGNTYSLNSDVLPIQSWTDEKITIGSHRMSRCRDNIIIVNLITEEVESVTKNKNIKPAGCDLPTLDRPRISHLIDGWDEHFQKLRTKSD